jgi:hypothetical protein
MLETEMQATSPRKKSVFAFVALFFSIKPITKCLHQMAANDPYRAARETKLLIYFHPEAWRIYIVSLRALEIKRKHLGEPRERMRECCYVISNDIQRYCRDHVVLRHVQYEG